MSRVVPSQKAARFTESVIREMTRLAEKHGAVNLSQGFPDFPAPDVIKDAACAAIRADVNQYAVTWGARPLREAIAAQFTRRHGVPVVADEQVTVCCGATETMMATLLAPVDPGDEVIVFEPFYENYGPDAIVSGARAPLRHPAGARLEIRSGRISRGVRAEDAGGHHQHAEQPDRESVQPRGVGGNCAPCAGTGTSSRSPTRSTSTSCTTGTATCQWRRSTAWRTGR